MTGSAQGDMPRSLGLVQGFGIPCWKFQAGISSRTCASFRLSSTRRSRSLHFFTGLVILLLTCQSSLSLTSGPAKYFGSVSYYHGHRLEDSRYQHLDALTIKHIETGIIMWSCAIDVREHAGHEGLRDGDQVLFHFTDEDSFRKITSLEDPQLFASMKRDDSDFGYGCYATMKAPHDWKSKSHTLLNNYWPVAKTIQSLRGKPWRKGEILEDFVTGKVGEYVNKNYCGKADHCISLIVDRQVAKNVMKEDTDAPAMPNGYSA